ncbi:MAG: hypothetical protein LBQ94_10155 [Treponema sp.]|jgi:hypothetical protein|nr:hypothetical protein [Treponema sp.]
MRDLTEEEYDALDERLTKADKELDHIRKGFLSCKPSYMVFLDEETSKLLDEKASASPSPREVIASMLRKETIPSP